MVIRIIRLWSSSSSSSMCPSLRGLLLDDAGCLFDSQEWERLYLLAKVRRLRDAVREEGMNGIITMRQGTPSSSSSFITRRLASKLALPVVVVDVSKDEGKVLEYVVGRMKGLVYAKLIDMMGGGRREGGGGGGGGG